MRYRYSLRTMAKPFANCGDPDQTPRSLASDLHLHCFAIYPFRGLQTAVGYWLIVLRFNDTSALVGHFVSSPREREKRDRRWKRGTGKKEEQEWKGRNRRNKNIPPIPLPATRIAGLAQRSAKISWMPRWLKIQDSFATPDLQWVNIQVCLFLYST